MKYYTEVHRGTTELHRESEYSSALWFSVAPLCNSPEESGQVV